MNRASFRDGALCTNAADLINSLMFTIIACACFSTAPVIADDAQELQRANELNAKVLQLYKVGKYDQAIDKGKEALAIYERVLGPVHPRVASALNNLASLYKSINRYAEAESLFRRSLIDNLRQTPSFRAGKDSKGLNPVSVAVQHTVE